MTAEEIKKVLELHALWLGNREGGERADLSGSDLSGSNLSGSNLSGANLYGAHLYGANLSDAKDAQLVWARTEILPREGEIIGWKKCQSNVLVRLMVGKKAKRSNATGRKCRAEYAKVLEVIGAQAGISLHDNKTEYRTGKIVRCDAWN